MNKAKPSVLFIGKRGNHYCEEAEKFLRKNFNQINTVMVTKGEEYPLELENWQGDYLISFLNPLIVKKITLDNVRVASINLHPGSPDYPGIGCTNFAVYNGETRYGVTVHHMKPAVDTGEIIFVDWFDIYEGDDVHSLTMRCYSHLQGLFYRLVDIILCNREIPKSNETWTRKPYTRSDLDELSRVTLGMDVSEIRRRVKAMEFPGAPGAFIELDAIKLSIKL